MLRPMQLTKHDTKHRPVAAAVSVGSTPANPVDSTERRASLFRNGRNQAIRIPREFEIAGTEVSIHKEGERLVLTPVRKHCLAQLLASWEPLHESPKEDGFEFDDPPPQVRPGF